MSQRLMRPEDNPFYTGTYCGHPTFVTATADRLEEVKDFDADQCRAALNVSGLQASVESAVKRRLAKLEKAL